MRHALLAVLLIAATAAAQDADPLRGPDVATNDTNTLVDRSMTGGFQRIEGRPESAALVLLELDPDTRERANAVIQERDLSITFMLVDELDAVREITDHITAGDADAARQRLVELWTEFEPDAPHTPLLEPLDHVLDGEQHAELTRIVNEYWSAWIDSQRPRDADDEQQIRRRLAFQLFQEEVRRAYDASLRSYRDALDALYNALDPTPEQREAIRTIVIDHIKETRLQPTPQQRRDAWHDIYELLDDERRKKFFDYLLRRVVTDE